MNKVLLISPNQEKMPYPVAPIGLLYIAHALKKAGFAPSMLDLCFSNNVNSDIKKSIRKNNPDFIGISLRNVDNLTFPKSVSYLPAFKEIIKTIKHHTSAPIILGGSAFSLFPRDMLSLMDCDWGVVGEGEEALVELLGFFDNGKTDYGKIYNLVWKKNNKIYRNRIKYLCSSFDFVLDYSLVDNHRYVKNAGIANVQTKRGCKFKCSYCTYPSIEGKSYRLRDPETVADEMSLLEKKYAIPHVFFVDDVFTYPAEHALSICEALLNEKIEMKWSCFASPYGISKKLLIMMKKAGCTHIEFGSDALSDGVLSKMHKPFSVKDILKASRLCREIGIKCAHYIIFGAPGENCNSLKAGFDMIRKLNGDAIIAMIGIRIYPGTELEKLGVREGIIRDNADLLSPRFYLSSEISTDELLKKVTKFAHNSSYCIVPGLGIRSSEKMYSVLRKYYHEGPLWGYLG